MDPSDASTPQSAAGKRARKDGPAPPTAAATSDEEECGGAGGGATPHSQSSESTGAGAHPSVSKRPRHDPRARTDETSHATPLLMGGDIAAGVSPPCASPPALARTASRSVGEGGAGARRDAAAASQCTPEPPPPPAVAMQKAASASTSADEQTAGASGTASAESTDPLVQSAAPPLRQPPPHRNMRRDPADPTTLPPAAASTSTLTTATPPISQTQALQKQSHADAEADAGRCARIGRVRDQALVPGVIALVLSFLPMRDLMRLRVGAVSRSWLFGLRQPTAWSALGCRFEWVMDHACMEGSCHEGCRRCSLSRRDLPLWLRGAVSRLRCGLEWLRSAKLFAALRSFASVRHLHLAACGFHIGPRPAGYEFNISAADIRESLRALPLQSLVLADPDPNVDRPLFEAVCGADGAAAAGAGMVAGAGTGAANSAAAEPLMAHWAHSLPRLCCCDILLSQPSGVLDSLHLYRWTELRSLSFEFLERSGARIDPNVVALLPRALSHECMPRLQSLAWRFQCYPTHSAGLAMQTGALLAALPHLPGLTELDVGFPLRMSEQQPAGWLPGLHLMPALRMLRCDLDLRLESASAFAASLAQAPGLEVLQVGSYSAAALICIAFRCLHERNARVAPVRTLRLVDHPSSWKPTLLELDETMWPGAAALAHLERLECWVRPANIPLLASLPQLRVLRVDIDRGEWADADLRALGELRLPRLESLLLDSKIRCVYKDPKSGGDLVSAPFSPLTTDGGLCHLLLLPSLTHLKLPWLAPQERAQLLHLASASDRPPIRLELPAPPPPRYICDPPLFPSSGLLEFLDPDPRTDLEVDFLDRDQ